MIISRSPLRVSLGGGGSDLPSYYASHGGFLIAGAIDKYVYVLIHSRFVDGFLLKYSQLEETSSIDEIRHPIIREALRLVDIRARNLEITSMADIPAGTGLGSSGSFATALLKGLHTYKKNLIHPQQLAEQACHIEIDILKEPIGKQDQYIAAFGGITCLEFKTDGSITASALSNGALGGKLVGAGGGGFLMFYAKDKVRLRHAMHEQGLREVRFRFDFEGTRIVSHE